MTDKKTFRSPLRFACVCASNVNRSMEGHRALSSNGFNVCSYGTNSQITMPGPDGKAIMYDFGTTYNEIAANMKELVAGIVDNQYEQFIEMIEKDAKVKEKPERFTSTFESNSRKTFDVIFTYQKTPVMEKVIQDFLSHGNMNFELCHVINIETKDDRKNALTSANHTLRLAERISEVVAQEKDLTEELENILQVFIERDKLQLSCHVVAY